MQESFKKIVSTVLIITMIFTNVGFVTLAESVSDVIESNESVSNNNDGIFNKYYEEMLMV